MSTYEKSHQPFEEQLNLLVRRGLTVEDESKALSVLSRVGYYKFGSYLYPLRKESEVGSNRLDEFKEGATFGQAVALYEFDRGLRVLCHESLDLVEHSIKVRVAYYLGRRDKFGHASGNFHRRSAFASRREGKPDFESWQEMHGRSIGKNKAPHIKRFVERYKKPLPIWVAIEVMSFSEVAWLLEMLKPEVQNEVSSDYKIEDGDAFATWVRSLRQIRNFVAHHDRLWNRVLVDLPAHPAGADGRVLSGVAGQEQLHNRPYAGFLILAYLMRAVDEGTDWPYRMKHHLSLFPSCEAWTLSDLGAPQDWQEDPLWD